MHPNSLDLEAFTSGESYANVQAHVGECADCHAFVEKLGALPPRLAVPKLEAEVERLRRLVPVLSIVIALVAPRPRRAFLAYFWAF